MYRRGEGLERGRDFRPTVFTTSHVCFSLGTPPICLLDLGGVGGRDEEKGIRVGPLTPSGK